MSLAAILVVAVGLWAGPAWTQAEPSEAQLAEREQLTRNSPLFGLAMKELEELEQKDRSTSSGGGYRSNLLSQNLSRYFTRYSVPEDADKLRRLLGTAQRTTRDAGRIFIGAATSVAQQEDASAISPAHLQRVTSSLLPKSEIEDGDLLFFFNQRDETQRVLIERWDIEALADTGMVWEVLADLAQSVVAPGLQAGNALDLEPATAELLAETLLSYGLLIFRLSGEIASSALEPEIATRHMRDAVKILRTRADGKSAPITSNYRPQRGANTLSGPPVFTDVTDSSGIDFRHRSSDWIGRFRRFGPLSPTFSGGGVAAGDIDNNGWPDLVLCGGRGCSVYLNRDGVFEGTEEKLGVDGEARMPILADFDNDDDLDLFVTFARDPNRLFLNDGQGFFQLTSNSGLETDGDISGPAAALDVDNDGLLDIYVGNFGDYLNGASSTAARDSVNGLPNRLYRNLGLDAAKQAPRFLDISEQAGVGDTGWAQALSHFDADRDGDQDIYVANDFGRNQFLLNRGDGTFERGAAKTGTDDAFHGMNVAFADLNKDGYGDIFITNIWFWASAKREVNETNTLLMSTFADGDLSYERSQAPFLLDHDSGWAWAGLFFDLENDGDDDLFVANGFTDYMTFAQYRPHPEKQDQLFAVNNGREANLLFLNANGTTRAKPPTTLLESTGVELPSLNTRSAALLDYDRDGDLDLVLTTFHERAHLLRNDSSQRSNSPPMLQITLKGDPKRKTNRDAIGAQLRLTLADGNVVWRTIAGGEGYLGMSDLPVEFGTAGTIPKQLEILWPNGELQVVTGIPSSGRMRLSQGKDSLETLP